MHLSETKNLHSSSICLTIITLFIIGKLIHIHRCIGKKSIRTFLWYPHIVRKRFFQTEISWHRSCFWLPGLLWLSVFHYCLYLSANLFKLESSFKRMRLKPIKYCICHYNIAVTPCTKFRSDHYITTWITAEWNSHRILIIVENRLWNGPQTYRCGYGSHRLFYRIDFS